MNRHGNTAAVEKMKNRNATETERFFLNLYKFNIKLNSPDLHFRIVLSLFMGNLAEKALEKSTQQLYTITHEQHILCIMRHDR